jgi:hypothetical protein
MLQNLSRDYTNIVLEGKYIMFKATSLQTDKEDGTASGSVSPVIIEMANASIGQNVIAQALNNARAGRLTRADRAN